MMISKRKKSIAMTRRNKMKKYNEVLHVLKSNVLTYLCCLCKYVAITIPTIPAVPVVIAS